MAGSLIEYYRTHPADIGYPLLSRQFMRALAPLLPLLVAASGVMLPLAVRLARRMPLAAACC